MGEDFIIFGAGIVVGFVIGLKVGKNEGDSGGGKLPPETERPTGGSKGNDD